MEDRPSFEKHQTKQDGCIVSNIINNRLDIDLNNPLKTTYFQNYIESVLGDGYCLTHNTFITMGAITMDKIEQVSKTETIIQTIRAVYDSEYH